MGWIVTLLAALTGIAGCGGVPGNVSDTGQQYKNWSNKARYVGREACKTCHQEKYDTFVQSQMGRSWKKATHTLSVADFESGEPIFSESENLYYLPFRRGEDLFVREYRLVGADTVHNRVEQIDFIVGSGQHTNSHIYESNGYLYQIPVTWYVQDQKWGLAPGFSSGNSRFSRPITQQCMTCHNGYAEFFSGSENRFRTVPSGIGCEKCHGPGSIHVEEKQSGIIVDVTKEIDYSIVNPGKLSPERQLDVCMRCHQQAAEVFVPGREVDSFRPGQKLTETMNVFWPRQPDSVEVFKMASHPDRLGMSACFRASWVEGSSLEPMTCITCHDPHLPIEAVPEQSYRATCQSCHEASTAPVCSEPSVAAGTNTTACSSCHMPQSKTQDIPNVRITDHFIRVVKSPVQLSEDEIESRREFIRMASLMNAHPTHSNTAEGFMSYYELITNRPGMLDSARVHLRRAKSTEPGVDLTESFIRLWYLEEDYQSIRKLMRSGEAGPLTTAWSYFRVGEAYSASNELGTAIDYLKEAVERSPGHLRFMERLASTYTDNENHPAARKLFTKIDEANPNFEDAVNNRGFSHLVTGQFEAAEKDFLTAIALYPDAVVALGNLASLYANTDRKEEAKILVERLLALDPGNDAYIRLYRAVSR